MKTGEEYEQPASIVILSSFVFSNTQQLLLAGIGEPYDSKTGKAWSARIIAISSRQAARPSLKAASSTRSWARLACQLRSTISTASTTIPASASWAAATSSVRMAARRRSTAARCPKGEPRWGAGWKQATAKWYRCNTKFNTQGSVYAHRDNFMDLDPIYKDALGRPLIRLTYNGTDNDHAMSRYVVGKLESRDQGDEPDPLRGALSAEEFYHRAVSVDPQHGWHYHGGGPEEQRGEPLFAGLGRAQSLHRNASVFPQQPIQSNRHAWRIGLFVGQGDH